MWVIASESTPRKIAGALAFALGSIGTLCVACQQIELRFEHVRPGTQGAVDAVEDAGTSGDAGQPPPVECENFPLRCEGERAKCTLLFYAERMSYSSGCLPDHGEAGVGQTCTRTRPGYDSCEAGNFCTAVGLGRPSVGPFACRQLCSSSAGCGDELRCLKLEGGDFGVCLTPCRIFDDACTEGARCVAGKDTGGRYFGYCSIFGEGEDDAPCVDDSECGAGLACEQNDSRCRALCDGEHRCPGDRRCLPLGLADPQSPRLCVP